MERVCISSQEVRRRRGYGKRGKEYNGLNEICDIMLLIEILLSEQY